MAVDFINRNKKTLIACIHLAPLPGAPLYRGSMAEVIDTACKEAELYEKAGVDALIVENFNDIPFYPDRVPDETVAAMAVVIKAVLKEATLPAGVNVLRNCAGAAVAIAAATEASFIRVNVHTGAMLTDQGIVEGKASDTMRQIARLSPGLKVFADVQVKHAAPLAPVNLSDDAKNNVLRGMADALIVSGKATGSPPDIEHLREVREAVSVPVLAGSGVIPERLSSILALSDGCIVGSCFKEDGDARRPVDPARLEWFMDAFRKVSKK